MKKALILLTFIPTLSTAQSITSTATEIFPGTDSAVIVLDTVVVSVNEESNTVSLTFSNGQKIYAIASVETTQEYKRYYLAGKKIDYVEIHRWFILVAFTISPDQPIKLIDFTK